MFGKAIRDGVVVEVTNLYDHFFVPTRECKADEKAVNLPYFDGDYWPAAAESVIERLQQEDRENPDPAYNSKYSCIYIGYGDKCGQQYFDGPPAHAQGK